MNAVAVVRYPCGAVEEVPIVASPAEIDQLVQDGWELYLPWSLQDYGVLIVWCLMAVLLGVGTWIRLAS